MPDCFLRPLLFSVILFTSLLPNCAFSQTSQPDTAAAVDAARDELANRYIHEILPYWQSRLQLDGWDVHVLLTRPSDLRSGTLGNIHWDAGKKSATIHVMSASGYVSTGTATDTASILKDMQVTIVHELVHLELASLPVSDADRSNQEFAIDHLTDALLQTGTPPEISAVTVR
jgi:hypothetical protein